MLFIRNLFQLVSEIQIFVQSSLSMGISHLSKNFSGEAQN